VEMPGSTDCQSCVSYGLTTERGLSESVAKTTAGSAARTPTMHMYREDLKKRGRTAM
jgi:hypothetical protein